MFNWHQKVVGVFRFINVYKSDRLVIHQTVYSALIDFSCGGLLGIDFLIASI